MNEWVISYDRDYETLYGAARFADIGVPGKRAFTYFITHAGAVAHIKEAGGVIFHDESKEG